MGYQIFAQELAELAQQLHSDNWMQCHAELLARIATTREIAQATNCEELAGRSNEIRVLLTSFFAEPPTIERLQHAYQCLVELAGSIRRIGNETPYGDVLPDHDAIWLFNIHTQLIPKEHVLISELSALGLPLKTFDDAEALLGDYAENTVFLLETDAFVQYAQTIASSAITSQVKSRSTSKKIIVSIGALCQHSAQLEAWRCGADILLSSPVDTGRLLSELAGLAWSPKRPYRVLLVDDNLSILLLHEAMLRSAGFDVLAISDSIAAFNAMETFSPEVCVLDIEMPHCSGPDLAAVLRSSNSVVRIPVIYLSGHTEQNYQVEARLAGGDDYLTKPVSLELLTAAVTTHARNYRIRLSEQRKSEVAATRMVHLRNALDAHAIVSVSSADGAITDVNEKFCDVSGYSRDQLIGRNHRIVKSGHHPSEFFADMWKTISTGKTWQGEVNNRCRDGSHYWVKTTISPVFSKNGSIDEYVSIRTDITDQKRMQADLRNQGRLLEAIRQSFQKFVVSHDLKSTAETLLDAMMTLTGSSFAMVAECIQGGDSIRYLKTLALQNLEELSTNMSTSDLLQIDLHGPQTPIAKVLANRVSVICNQLNNLEVPWGIEFSGVEFRNFFAVPIIYGELSIGILVLANKQGLYQEHTVSFLTPLLDTFGSLIEAARLRNFQQYVIDDLHRSKDAAQHAHTTRIELFESWQCKNQQLLQSNIHDAGKLAALLPESQGSEIIKNIRDASEEMLKLGEDFLRQLEQTEKAERTLKNTSSTVQSANELQQRKILVAEDNPANQAVLRMQLQVLGYSAEIAGDGITALALWQSGGHDLILADRNMPELDGLAFTRAIRAKERENGGYVPIIGITAVHHADELLKCHEAGMDDALSKPIELEDLRRTLERWLPNASPIPQKPISQDTGVVLRNLILDFDYLARIVGRRAPNELREIVDLFTMSAHTELPKCRAFLKAREATPLAFAMHKLKSSARVIGAQRFANLAEKLEIVCRRKRLGAAGSLLDELESCVLDIEVLAQQIAGLSDAEQVDKPAHGLDLNVLIIDDDPIVRRQCAMLLSSIGVENSRAVDSVQFALQLLLNEQQHFDLVIFDLNLPDIDGIELLRRLADVNYQGCLILCSGVEDRLIETAAKIAKVKGLNLLGAMKKPISRELLLKYVLGAKENVSKTQVRNTPSIEISAEDIVTGIQNDEFVVHFQPKVDAVSLKVIGVEALARWSKDGQFVSPEIFIKAAEENHLICQLSEILMTKAVIGGARLIEAGFPIYVSVNVSMNWLSDLRLPDFIMASIQAVGFNPEYLILEITETGVMEDEATSLDVMGRLRLKGFRLSIDDFGTGYSSMEQLRRFPFGELKLDRGFVEGATENPATRAILASSIEMAQKLNLTTVAEGVETQADLDLVRGLGCDLVQGWLIAKAMPLNDLVNWISERSKAS